MLSRLGIIFLLAMLSACGGSDASFDNGGDRLLTGIEVTPADDTMAINQQQVYAATGLYSDGSREDITDKASWSSSDTSVATVDALGRVTAIAIGETRISAGLSGVSGDTGLSVVEAVVSALQIIPPTATIPLNTTQDYRAFAIYSDGTVENVTFSAEWELENDSGILAAYDPGPVPLARELDDFGTAIGVAVGEDELVARFAGLTSSSNITVTEATLVSISVTPEDESAVQGTLVAYTATGNYSDGSTANLTKVVTWSSSEPDVATISNAADQRGLAAALSPGETDIIASFEGLSGQTGLTVVADPVVRIDVLPGNATIDVSESLQYQAIAVTETGRSLDVTSAADWTSSEESIARIDEVGLATGASAGTTTITADYQEIAGSAALTVRSTEISLVEINIEPVNASLYSLTSLQFTAIGIYSDGSNTDITGRATWETADRATLVVSNDDEFGRGLAFGLTPGNTSIAASLDGITGTTPVRVIERESTLLELVISPAAFEMPEGASTQYTAELLVPGERALDVSEFIAWSSANPSVATIDANGVARAIDAGDTLIQGSLNLVAFTLNDTAQLRVTEAPPEIVELSVTPAVTSIIEGGQQQYTARAIYSDGSSQDVTGQVDWSTGDSAVAVIDLGGLATGINAGETEIAARLQTGSGDVESSALLEVRPPAITGLSVTPPSADTQPGGSVRYSAVANYENGTTEDVSDIASWTSSDTTVAQVDSTGLATGLTPGNADIRATLATPTGSFTDAGRLTVNPPDIVIEELIVEPATAEVLIGNQQAFSARIVLSNGTEQDVTDRVSWSSSDPNIAAVNGSGVATGLSEGETSITATLSVGDTVFSDSGRLIVSAPEITIEELIVDPAQATVLINGSERYSARVLLSDGSSQDVSEDVSWTSSDELVAVVDNSGLAVGLKEGSANIIATLSYQGQTYTDSGKLDVQAPDITIIEIRVQPPTAEVIVSGTQQFIAEAVLSDGRVIDVTSDASWQSDNSTIATVDSAGLATGVSAGSTRVIATVQYDGDTASGDATLTVKTPPVVPEQLIVSPAQATVLIGSSQAYTARVLFSDGSQQDVSEESTWTSSDPGIAAVDSSGLALGIAEGQVDISASLNIDGTVFSDSGRLRVEAPDPVVTGLRVEPASSEILVESKQQFLAFAELSDGRDIEVTRDVSWSSSEQAVAHVNASGRATGLAAGDTDIIATLALDGANFTDSGALTVIAEAITIDELVVEPASADILVGGKQAFTARVFLSNGTDLDVTRDVSWVSSAPSIASVNSQGRATGLAEGTAAISASLSYEGETYTDSGELTVAPPAVTIEELVVDPATATVLVDGSTQFTARVLLSDGSTQDVSSTVSWQSSNAEIAHVDSTGIATGLSEGRSEIIASLTYEGESFSDSGRLTVEPPAITIDEIRVLPVSAEVVTSGQQQYTAEAVLSDGSTLDVTRDATWRSKDTTIASVTSTGLATGLAAGSTTISATVSYQGDTTTGSATLTVTPPLITVEALLVEPTQATVLVGSSQQFTARLIFSDGSEQNVTKDATWNSSDPGVASVDSAGLALGLAAGRADISAKLNVDGTQYSDSGRLRVEIPAVVVTGLRVAPETAEILVDGTQRFTATAELSDGSEIDVSRDVSWSSSDGTVAHINGSGLATGLDDGDSTITAVLVSDALNFTDDALLTVLPLPVTVDELVVEPEDAETLIDGSVQYTARALLSDGSEQDVTADVDWSSGNTQVAQINSAGLATGIAEGAATIQALLNYGDGLSAQDRVTLTVKAPEISVESIEVTPASASVPVDETLRYTATATLSDGSTLDVSRDVTWTSKNPDIATVNASGLATGLSEGDAVISAKLSTATEPVEGTAQLRVTPPEVVLERIEVTPQFVDIFVTEPGTQFRAQAFFSDGSSANVTRNSNTVWSSADSATATVSATGFVSGVAAGVTEITASYTNGDVTAADAGTVEVKGAELLRIDVSPANTSVAAGVSTAFTATAVYADGESVDVSTEASWQSSDEAVAMVDSSGNVETLTEGRTEISASFGGLSDAGRLTVTAADLVRVQIDPPGASGPVGTTAQLSLYAEYTDGQWVDVSRDAAWSSSDENLAGVDERGLVTFAGVGTAQISASFGGQQDSVDVTGTDPVLVELAIQPLDEIVGLGTEVTYTLYGIYSDGSAQVLNSGVTWVSTDESIATIDATGLAETHQQGSTTIRAAYDGESVVAGRGLPTLITQTSLTVTEATVVSVSILEGDVTGPTGTSDQLTLQATYSDATTRDVTQSASWSSSDDSLVSIVVTGENGGLLTYEQEGSATITALFGGASDAVTATGTAAIISQLVITPDPAEAPAGLTQQFTATAIYTDGTPADVTADPGIDWTSSDESVATVGISGLANALTVGSTTIGATIDGISASASFTVTDSVIVSLRITPASVAGPAGTSTALRLLAVYSDSSNEIDVTEAATWLSADNSVATVGITGPGAGITQLVAKGDTVITASIEGESTTAPVSVSDAVLEKLELAPVDESVAAGYPVQYTATGIYTDNSVEDLTQESNWVSSDTAIATISAEGLANTLSAGVTEITATYAGLTATTRAAQPSLSDSTSLTVTAAVVTSIAIDGPVAGPAGTEAQATATATYSDTTTRDVTTEAVWTTADIGIATVTPTGSGAGLVSLRSEGETALTARLGTATDTVSVTVTAPVLERVEVTPGKASIADGFSQAFAATAWYSDNSFADVSQKAIWSSSDEAIASVDASGLATGQSPGDATISASFQGLAGDALLTVTDAVITDLRIEPGDVNGPAGTRASLELLATYSDGQVIDLATSAAWASSDTDSVVVGNGAQGGQLDLLAEGSSTVSATYLDFPTESIQATVTAAELVSIQLAPLDEQVPAGVSVQYIATGVYTDGSNQDLTTTVDWSSSDTAVATVDASGLASTFIEGNSTITASYNGINASSRSASGPIQASTSLTVTAAEITSVTILPGSVSNPAGYEEQLSLEATYTDGSKADVTALAGWLSSNNSIASVVPNGQQAGLVSFISEGAAEISASFDGQSDAVTATVTAAIVTDFVVTPGIRNIPVGLKKKFRATAYFSDGSSRNVSRQSAWTIKDTSTASVNKRGRVKGLAEGETSVTALYQGFQASSRVNVKAAVVTDISIVPATLAGPIGTESPLTLYAIYSDKTQEDVTEDANTTWLSGDTKVATVVTSGAGAGAVSLVGVGTTEVSASFGNFQDAIPVSATAAELVDLIITPADASVAAGLRVQYTATGIFTDTGEGTPPADLTDSVTWSSSDTDVARIGSSEVTNSLAPGEAETYTEGVTNISATYLGMTATLRAAQTPVSESVPLTVTAAEVTSVVIEPGAVEGPAGTEQQRQLRANFTDGTSTLVTSDPDTAWSVANTAVATVVPNGSDAGLVSLDAEGSTTLTASYLGDRFSDSVDITVEPAVLVSIQLAPADEDIPVGTTLQYTVTAIYSDGGQADVTDSAGYSSSNKGVAVINASGLAEGVTQGATTIEASFGGESSTGSLTVTPAVVTDLRIVPGAIDAPLGTTEQLAAIASFSDGSERDVTTEVNTLFVSLDEQTATVVPTGEKAGFTTLAGEGATTIIASYQTASASIGVNVSAAEVVEISIDPENAESPSGIDVRYRAYGTFTDGSIQELVSDVAWSSSNLDVARMTIEEDGGAELAFAETLSEGSTTITATYTAPTAVLRAASAPVSASTALTVSSATVTDIQIVPPGVSAPVGTQQALQLLANYSDGTQDDVTLNGVWLSVDPSIASVGSTGANAGQLSINGVGTTKVSARFEGQTASIDVSGTAAIINQLVVQPLLETTPAGVDVAFTATGIYTDGSSEDVSQASSWSSSDPAVASVDGNGNVQALKAGTATITALFDGLQDSGAVVVTAPVLERVEVKPAASDLPAGTSTQLTLTAIYSDGSTSDVTKQAFWKSSNPTVATVGASTGVVTGKQPGIAQVTGGFGGETDIAAIAVSDAILESITVTPAQQSVALGQTAQYQASGSYSDGRSEDISLDVAWSAGNPAVAVIDSTGKAQSVSTGSTDILATLDGITGSAGLTVRDIEVVSLSLTPTSLTAIEGTTPQQLTAEATFTDDSTQDVTALATWASDMPEVAAVVPNGESGGLVSFLSAGDATITATYEGAAAQAPVTVEPNVLVTIDVTPQDASIAAGRTEAYSATGTYSDGRSEDISDAVAWTSDDTAVATIAVDGVATGVAAGSATIAATLQGVTGTAELEVTGKEIIYLQILPPFVNGPAGDMGKLRAVVLFTDLSVENVTAQGTWGVDDSDLVSLGTPGDTDIDYQLEAEGNTRISVSFGGRTTSIPVTISAAELVSIALSPNTQSLAAGLAAQFIATGTYTDGSNAELTDEATWTSSDSAIAEITAKGESTGRSPGTATITASYEGVDGTATHEVTPAEATGLFIDPPEWQDPAGTTNPFTARAVYTDGTDADVTRFVTWASDDGSIATVLNDGIDKGLVTLEAIGVTDITATLGGLTARSTVTVTAPVIVDLFVEPYGETFPDGGFLVQFSAIAVFSDGSQSDVTAEADWYSTDPEVAVPDEDGAVYTISPGNASISARYQEEEGFAPMTVVAAVVESIQIEPGSVDEPKGTRLQLEAWAFYNNGKSENVTTQATWSSQNPDIAFVIASGDEAGGLALVEVGTTNVSATFSGVTQSIPVEVSEAVLVDLQIQPTNVELPLGIDQQFEAIGIYSDGSSGPIFSLSGQVFRTRLTDEVVWTSSDTNVAAINGEGFAESRSTGTTTISASYQGFQDSTSMTVQEAEITNLQVTPYFNVGPVGTTVQLTVIATYTNTGEGQNGQDVTDLVEWTSSNGSVATVSPGGLLSFNGVSSAEDPPAVLTATLEGVTGTAIATGTAAILERIALTPDPLQGKVGVSSLVTATGYYSDGTSEVLNAEADWQIGDSSIATVSNSANSGGLVTGIAEGTTSVRATLGDISDSATVNIAPAALTGIQVTPSEVIGVEGASASLTATGFYDDGSSENLTADVTWLSEDTAVATVINGGSNAGTLSLVGAGITRVSATLDGIVDFANVVVAAATLEEIELRPENAEIPKGATQQYTAILRYSNGSSEEVTEAEGLTWSSSFECAAEINQSGLATGRRVLPFICVNTTISAEKDGVRGTARLRVSQAQIIDLEIQPTGLTEPAGTSGQLEAIATYSDNSEEVVTNESSWESSDESIVQVSNCGLLEDILGCSTGEASLLAPGNATVTATFDGFTDTTDIVVTDAVLVDIVVTPAFESLAEGLTQLYNAEGVFSDGQQTPINGDVTWRSSNQNVASITPEGLATALNAEVAGGTTQITATLGDISGSATLEVTDATVDFIQVFPAVPDPIFVGGLEQFTAEATFTNGESVDVTNDVDWSVSPRELGTFIPFVPGLFVGESVGIGSVEAQYKPGLLDPVLTDSADISVIEPQVISIEIDTGRPDGEAVVMTQGVPEDWTATAELENGSFQDVTLSVLWTTSDEEIASVSFGTVDPLSTGGATITATYTPGTAGASRVQDSVSDAVDLTVEAPALLALEVTPIETQTNPGGIVEFVARAFYASDPDDGVDVTEEAEWLSSDPDVAQVSDGAAQALSLGTTSISASFGGLSDSGTLNVVELTAQDIDVFPGEVIERPGEVLTMFKKAKFDFLAVARFPDGTIADITKSSEWKSSNKQSVKVKNDPNNKGEVEAKDDKGPSEISAELKDESVSSFELVDVDDSCEYQKKDFELREMYPQPRDESIAAGDSLRMVVTGWYVKDSSDRCLAPVPDIKKNKDENDAEERLVWSVTEGGDIVEIDDEDGVATAVGCGTATIQAEKTKTNTDGDGFDVITATTTLTVVCP